MGISFTLVRHLLKNPIDHADVKMYVLVQAGAKAMDKGHQANVQSLLVYRRRIGTVGL
jgi:hypothetical protein